MARRRWSRYVPLAALGLALVACDDRERGVAQISGRLAASQAAAGQLGLDGKTLLGLEDYHLDSEQTSLTGLRVEILRRTIDGAEVGVEGTAVPDSQGRFSVSALPEVTKLPPFDGSYEVRLKQPDDAPVRYGAGGSLRWLLQGEDLQLSLPLMTRWLLPMWSDHEAPPPEEHDPLLPQLAADDVGKRLVYVTPTKGVGVLDPKSGTVDRLLAAGALTFSTGGVQSDTVVRVAPVSGTVVVGLVRGWDQPARFVLMKLSVFADPTQSELLDLDKDAAALAASVTVLAAPAGKTAPPERVFEAPGFRVRSFETADGKRVYLGQRRSTWAIDLAAREVVAAWHDGGYLGAYNAESGLLFFDLPGGLVRVRDAATGALVADKQLAARFLLGVTPLPGGQTLVSYQAKDSVAHRMAVFDHKGDVVQDVSAGDFLGYTDRYHRPEYDWGKCAPEYFAGAECPSCPPRPTDFFPSGMSELTPVDMVFDAQRQRLVLPGGSFALEGGLFHPLPATVCGRFPWTDHCGGTGYLDLSNRVEVVRSLQDRSIMCTRTIDDSDLVVELQLLGKQSGSSDPVVVSSLGVGFVPTSEGLNAIHYANPDAAEAPAVQDLRGVTSGP